MTATCLHPGCNRRVRYNGNSWYSERDKRCSQHDGNPLHGDVCLCIVAVPRPFPECDRCKRAVVGLWPPDRYRAALRAYPQLAHQTIDWGLRTRGAPRGEEVTEWAPTAATSAATNGRTRTTRTVSTPIPA